MQTKTHSVNKPSCSTGIYTFLTPYLGMKITGNFSKYLQSKIHLFSFKHLEAVVSKFSLIKIAVKCYLEPSFFRGQVDTEYKKVISNNRFHKKLYCQLCNLSSRKPD